MLARLGVNTDSAGVIKEHLESGPLSLYVMDGVNVDLWFVLLSRL